MPLCTIMRGPSGAGKSTWVHDNRQTSKVCSADNYFMRAGVYCFDPGKLHEAHTQCLEAFRHALSLNDNVVVDNTNIRLWHFQGYVEKALAAGYDVEIVECAVRRYNNTHGVPYNTIARMTREFESLPKEWEKYRKTF